MSFAETVAATDDLYNDPRSDDVKQALWDFSAIDGFSVSEDEVQEMASTDHAASLYMKQMRAAFVIRDPRLTELGDQYIEMMRELGSPWQNKLFANIDDARKWIDASH